MTNEDKIWDALKLSEHPKRPIKVSGLSDLDRASLNRSLVAKSYGEVGYEDALLEGGRVLPTMTMPSRANYSTLILSQHRLPSIND